MRYKIGNILWGIAFILAGVGVAGNIFELWDFNLFFNGWWTLFIIIPCFISIIQNGFNTGNSIGIAIGALLLLSAQNILPRGFSWKLFFPAILVIIGLSIIFKPKYKAVDYKPGSSGSSSASNESSTQHQQYTYNSHNSHNWNTSCGTDLLAVFCGNNGSFADREFKGASCTAVFGGVELDLRNAKITHDVTIDATAIFGGVDIFTDNNVQVVYRSVPIFGGVDCRVPARDKNLPTVFVNSVAVFGGIEIK